MIRRNLVSGILVAIALTYPLYGRLGRLPAAWRARAVGRDRRLGLEPDRGLRGADLGRPHCVLRRRCLRRNRGVHAFRLAADRRRAAWRARRRAHRRDHRRTHAAPLGALFQHGHHRRRRVGARVHHQLGLGRRGAGDLGACGAAHRPRPLLHLGNALLLHLPRRARCHPVPDLAHREQPRRLLSARHQGLRARRALARRRRRPLQTLRLHAERRADGGGRLALRHHVWLHRSRVRASASSFP